LLQRHRIVVANFVPSIFGLFWRNQWQPFAEPRLKNTGAYFNVMSACFL